MLYQPICLQSSHLEKIPCELDADGLGVHCQDTNCPYKEEQQRISLTVYIYSFSRLEAYTKAFYLREIGKWLYFNNNSLPTGLVVCFAVLRYMMGGAINNKTSIRKPEIYFCILQGFTSIHPYSLLSCLVLSTVAVLPHPPHCSVSLPFSPFSTSFLPPPLSI